MGKIIRHTDLADEQPGARADVDLPLEDFEFEAQVPLVRFKVKTRTSKGSPLATAMAAVALVVGGCASAGTVSALGAPTWAALVSLLLPFAYYLCVGYVRHRQAR
jgi:hypothetical protein